MIKVIKACTQTKKYFKEVEKMVSSNAFILTEMEEEAKRRGREEGIKEGIKEIAIKMLKKGKSIEEIIEITELPRSVIEELSRQKKE